MRIKQTLLGIVLAFTTAGAVATSVTSESYQKIYDKQNEQATLIKKAQDSEFISTGDKDKLAADLQSFKEAKETKTKDKLEDIIDQEQATLSEVQKNLEVKEAKVAKDELKTLQKTSSDLEKKSKEAFVLDKDTKDAEKITSEVSKITATDKVKPIREVSKKSDKLVTRLSENQTTTKKISDDLKEVNKRSEDLGKKKYLNDEDKKSLEKDSKDNSQFFKDADNLEKIEQRQTDSKELVTKLESKQKNTETDFKDNESKTRELLTSSEKLLAEGSLNKEETDKLKGQVSVMKSSLDLKEYQPGDLGSKYTTQKSDHDTIKTASDGRIAEAKKKAEAEAREQARKDAEAQKKAEEASAGPTLVGEWYQAPPGKKFLKAASGKTYGQVKNPGNFSLITTEEAANYSPGHGNGSAKQ